MATTGGKIRLFTPIAFADGSVSIGNVATLAFGNQIVVIGPDCQCTADATVAIGNNARCLGASSVAIGNQVITPGGGCIAIGSGVTSGLLGSVNVVLGINASVTDSVPCSGSVVIGIYAGTGGSGSVSIGYGATSAISAISIGTYTNAYDQSVVLGYYSGVGGPSSVAIGDQCSTTDDGSSGSVAIGRVCGTYGHSSIVMGNNSHAGFAYYQFVQFGIAIGTTCESRADGAIAIGMSAIAEQVRDIVIGYNSNTSGSTSGRNIVIGDTSFSEADVELSVLLGGSHIARAASTYSIIIGQDCEIEGGSGYNSLLGTRSTIGAGSPFNFAAGLSLLIGDNSGHNVAIGTEATIGDVSSDNLCIGHTCRVYGPNNVGLGSLAAIGTSSVPVTNGIAIGASTTVAMEGGIAIGGLSGAFGLYDLVLGYNSRNVSDSTGGNIIVGSNCAMGSLVGNSIILGPSAVVDNLSINAISVGYGAKVGASLESSQAYGTNALATRSREVIFNAAGTGTAGVELFHAPANLAGPLDLFRFDVTTIVNNHDTAMYLLYKDATGTIVMAPVVVNGITGALSVPL
jgi:hypothetical protein